MLHNKKYLSWCTKQNKGIRLGEISKSLQNAYLKKSQAALKSMHINAREEINEWAISASYYAKYFAVYALLSRLGIKCEIHDCTIALFGYLFSQDISEILLKDLRKSKEDRIDAQYYTSDMSVDLTDVISKCCDFVITIESIIDGLDQQKIDHLRKITRDLL